MEVCYACGKDIEERIPPEGPPYFLTKPVGKYTVRRQTWDENWKLIEEDHYFHEKCYYDGFISAIRYGLAVKEWEDSGRGDVDEVLSNN
jgi:hypothetical protein